MLVLTRKVGQAIMIGDNITITLCEINGTQVKIGIDAPKDVHIERDDIKNGRLRGKVLR